MLRAEGADVFSADGRRYRFVSDAAGRVQGVRIVDPGYDVAATENSVVDLGRNDAPTDARGPNRPEWAALTGRYVGTFVGAPIEAELTISGAVSTDIVNFPGRVLVIQAPRLSLERRP
jgi:hypothetical protein